MIMEPYIISIDYYYLAVYTTVLCVLKAENKCDCLCTSTDETRRFIFSLPLMCGACTQIEMKK